MSGEACFQQNLDGDMCASFISSKAEDEEKVLIEENKDKELVARKLDFKGDNCLNEKNNEKSPVQIQQFDYPKSTSTPVARDDAPVISISHSDCSPLLKRKSSTEDSCLGKELECERDKDSVSCGCSYLDENEEVSGLVTRSSPTPGSLMIPGTIKVPIVGHETIESRSRFTVYKIHVMVEDDETGWFIFRRYSDFVHLNDQLRVLFPNFRLSLPPKRWFRDNFDPQFLEERQQGLGEFLSNITGHRDICNSQPVRDFFCFDDPPGPYDSLEESRAQCETLEETVHVLRQALTDKETELDLAKDELELYKQHVQLLTDRLSELNKMSDVEKSKLRSTLNAGLRAGGKFDIDALFGSGGSVITPRSSHKPGVRVEPDKENCEEKPVGTDVPERDVQAEDTDQ